MTEKAFITNIQRFSLHDGDGVRSTVFFKGCLLRCRWCHNPETIDDHINIQTYFETRCIGCRACFFTCPQGAMVFNDEEHYIDRARCVRCGRCAEVCYPKAIVNAGRYLSVFEILEEVEKDAKLYEISGGGVTLSGGEPMLQIKVLEELCPAIRQKGMSCCIDTAGYVPFEYFERINDHVDTWLYDIKSMDKEIHRLITGKDNDVILENLKRLDQIAGDIVIRMPVMEGVNDSDENISAAAELLSPLEHVRKVDVLPIHDLAADKYRSLDLDYSFVLQKKATRRERVDEIIDLLKAKGLNAGRN